jgi:hypothetical protein
MRYAFALVVALIAGVVWAQGDPVTFPVRTDYDLGIETYPLAAADLDNDGDVDLALPESSGSAVVVMMNDGTGAFPADRRAVYSTSQAIPGEVKAGDLDADGDVDLVVSVMSGTIEIFINQGDGTQPAGTFIRQGVYPASNAAFLDVADLDGDGDLDIACARWDAMKLSILLNDGHAVFASSEYPLTTHGMDVEAGDLDGDGDRDLVITQSHYNLVSVHLNNGDGVFSQVAVYDLYGFATYPIGVDLGDLDGDGDLDVALASAYSYAVALLRNDGHAGLSPWVSYSTPDISWNVTVADIDLDGDPDLLSAVMLNSANEVALWLNDGTGVFGARMDFATGRGPTCVEPADLDGDGDQDLVTANNWDRSACVTVLFNGQRVRPVASAGDTQTVHPGGVVSLDGSGSYDPDANYPLSFGWSWVSKPAGSLAELSDPASANPAFTPDGMGDYVLSLVVTDDSGVSSLPDFVTVSTQNAAPVADAGDDRVIQQTGIPVLLGEDASYDPDGDDIGYAWTLLERPVGSMTVLEGADTASPSVVPDRCGVYNVGLIVTDVFGAVSDPDTVTVSCENVAPVADSGVYPGAIEGDTMQLDGSGSHDANGDVLTYRWSLVTVPAGSATVLSSPDQAITEFVADVAGTYVVSLVVNDGLLDSEPSNATIQVISRYDAAVASVFYIIDAIDDLPPGSLKNKNMLKPFTNKLNAILAKIDEGAYQEALDKLANDILEKTDGCEKTGGPEPNDWVITCEDQATLVALIANAMAYLEGML